jgi:hypothetical protein
MFARELALPGWGVARTMFQIRSHAVRCARAALVASIAITLVACGGEDQSDDSSDPPTNPATVDENDPPVANEMPATAVTSGETYNYDPDASDADGDVLIYSIVNKPQWASFDAGNGSLSGMPLDTDVGETGDISISINDGQDTTVVGPFRITVAARSTPPPPPPSNPPANTPPTISGTPMTSVVAGTAYIFQPAAADANPNTTLRFSISNRPAWATFSQSTGRLSGTPSRTNVGNFSSIRISVSDGTASVALPTFSIRVQAPPNGAPTITGTPVTAAVVGTNYNFQPSANDPDGNALTFSIQNKPGWATFSQSTGRLSGTPSAAGTTADVIISVSDGTVSNSLPRFSIQVTQSNRAPTISGTPATSVTVGNAYNFQPSGNDADGDTLRYTIQNKPGWATFSETTGRLSGTPTAAGTTSNIVISVTDNKVTTPASLAAFSITANSVSAPPPPPPPTTGSVTLDWTPPTSNTDGTSLSNLGSYRIRYGTSANSLNQSISISNPSISSYVVENLAGGTWYFSVIAVNASGTESVASNPVSATVQ